MTTTSVCSRNMQKRGCRDLELASARPSQPPAAAPRAARSRRVVRLSDGDSEALAMTTRRRSGTAEHSSPPTPGTGLTAAWPAAGPWASKPRRRRVVRRDSGGHGARLSTRPGATYPARSPTPGTATTSPAPGGCPTEANLRRHALVFRWDLRGLGDDFGRRSGAESE